MRLWHRLVCQWKGHVERIFWRYPEAPRGYRMMTDAQKDAATQAAIREMEIWGPTIMCGRCGKHLGGLLMKGDFQ